MHNAMQTAMQTAMQSTVQEDVRVALVTGANRGIGLATARRLARDGVHVVAAARSDVAGRAVADDLAGAGFAASHVVLDVTDAAQVRAAAKEVAERFGRLDVLVNSAGILPEATAEPAEAVDLALFEGTYATNVLGPVAVLEAFLPLLRRSTAGRVVNVSTTMGSLADQSDPASPFHSMVLPAYQSSKAALNGITVALAKALADTPVKVTSVCPGFVRTDLTPANRQAAPLEPEDAADVIHRAATLPDDAPSGTFVDARGVVPW